MRHKSVIWSLERDKFQEIVYRYNTIADILRHFGYPTEGGHYKTLYKRIEQEQIDISHIKLGIHSNKGRVFGPKRDINEYLVKDKIVNGPNLKKYLLRENLIKNECSKCGLKNEWQGTPLSLQLDHINGEKSDNRLNNLRLLCPNCHSQTETFSGRNVKQKRPKKHCLDCGKVIYKKSDRCMSCAGTENNKSNRRFDVAKDELARLIEKNTFVALGNMFGVSDNAVRKRARKFGLI